MNQLHKCLRILGVMLIWTVIVPTPARAQDQESGADRFFPRQGFMLSGYGGAGYNVVFAGGETPNNFAAIFAPIMLFQVSDRFLFEGEFEFEVEEGATATDLEYAQVDISMTNNLTLVAGKFLLPFNTFSERLHPTWINPLVSGPALYGSHGALTPADPLVPILSDVGVQLRGAFTLSRFGTMTVEAYATQGPGLEEDEHEDGDVTFGANIPDNNENKMIGGRIGFGVAPYFEVNLSGMTATYDSASARRFAAVGGHVEGRYKGFTLHSEVIQTWQDLAEEVHDESVLRKIDAIESALGIAAASQRLTRNGYWVQVGYRYDKWQPVVRLTKIFRSDLGGELFAASGTQLAIGLDYWFEPAVAIKVEYLRNDGESDLSANRIAMQLAFGF